MVHDRRNLLDRDILTIPRLVLKKLVCRNVNTTKAELIRKSILIQYTVIKYNTAPDSPLLRHYHRRYVDPKIV
jgi:beta-galactosidase beta subunit